VLQKCIHCYITFFQSETCSLRIPQLDFEVGALSLSGRFTTIEGLVTSLYENLKDTATAFYGGDSQPEDVINKTNCFLDKLNKIKTCELPVDIILTDPAGNSYVQVISVNKYIIGKILIFYKNNSNQIFLIN